MRHNRLFAIMTIFLLALLVSACSSNSAPVVPTAAPAAVSEPAAEATVASAPAGQAWERFDPNTFSNPTTIDNPWFPMKPGTQFVYEGITEEAGTQTPHRVVFTVTDLTKEIAGIRNLVIWDQDYSDGELVEAELAFFAQADDGTIWHFGQYPEVYESGKLVEAPAWIAGIQDARPGITIKAEPRLGAPSYSQGWGPAVSWTDRAEVDQVGQAVCVPFRCFEDVLVTRETATGEGNAFQLKYYAREVGNIRVGWKGDDASKETLELIEVIQLNPEQLAEVRAEAIKLEQRAYEISTDVYAQTAPMVDSAGNIVTSPPPRPTAGSAAAPAAPATGGNSTQEAAEIVVYTSELPASALHEFDFWDDPASPGGRLVGTINTGGNLDPPPENDPHVIFTVPVQSGVPYRCWVHMKVGAPKGVSQANKLWIQFSGAVDAANQEILKPDSGSYLTASGPTHEGWAWVSCDSADPASGQLITFRDSGEVTIRIQAGMEGVGFDQLILSPAAFLDQAPTEAIVKK